MDDGADLDLVDVSPIGSPDHSQITINQRWRGVEPYIDYETEHAAIFAVNSQYHCGTPQLSPHPRGLSKLNPSALDMNPSPPSLYSPDYPSTIEGTPSPLSYTSDYLDLEDDSPLPSTKFDDDLRFNHYPNLLIYDSDEPGDPHAWNPHHNFAVSWDAGDESDASESSDEYRGYITFAGRSASLPPELEPGLRRLDSLESSVFALDFPEDVDELPEHDTVAADGDVISCLRRSISAPPSESLVELTVEAPEDFQNSPVYVPDISLTQMRECSEDRDERELFPHLRCPRSIIMDVSINVPLSPLVLMIDGFPDDAPPPYSDLVVVE